MTAKNTLSVLKMLFKMKMCSTTDTPPTVLHYTHAYLYIESML